MELATAMCKLRGAAFWSLDSVTGGVVKRAYRELRAFDAMDSQSGQLAEHRQSALRKLLQHAVDTTEFYSDVRGKTLDEFPVVDKNGLRERQESFMSSKYNKSELVTMSTSGSTGTPFVCYQDRGKKRRVTAEVIHYSESAGYRVGGNLIYLRAITEETRKSKLQQWVQNETLLDISNLDDLHIERLLSIVESSSRSGSMLLAYASTYDAMKDYFRRNGVAAVGNSRIQGIVASSEMLFDETRQTMADAFGCRCYSRYSNQENGIIGQDDLENNTFILNEAHYVVEILEMDCDQPATQGEVGRIVVTDLYNYAMPMIRYDTGDVGSIVYIERNGFKKRAIADFGGRRVDQVSDCAGRRLSPHAITNSLWRFSGIRQFQFIQETQTRYTVKISPADGFAALDEVRLLLQKILGDRAVVDVKLVDEIPVLSSGKRKYIVNNMISAQDLR